MHATLTHQGCCFGWSGSPACSKADALVQVTVSCLRSKVPNTAHQSWKRESHSPNGTRTSSGTGTSSRPGPRRTQGIRCTAGWRRPCCEAWWACPGAEPRRPGEYLGRPQRTQLNVYSSVCISQRYVYRKLPYSSCPWRTTSPCLGRGLSGVRVKWDRGGGYTLGRVGPHSALPHGAVVPIRGLLHIFRGLQQEGLPHGHFRKQHQP